MATKIAEVLSKSITGDRFVALLWSSNFICKDFAFDISSCSFTAEAIIFVLSKSTFSFNMICCSSAVNFKNDVSVPLGLVPEVGANFGDILVFGSCRVCTAVLIVSYL